MFRENCSEQNENDEAESRDKSSSVVERVDDDEDDESDDDDPVCDQRKEPELSQLLEEGLDWRPNRFGDLVAGLGVAQEPFDAVAVEDAPVDGDGHQDQEAETVAPLEVLITLETNIRINEHGITTWVVSFEKVYACTASSISHPRTSNLSSYA